MPALYSCFLPVSLNEVSVNPVKSHRSTKMELPRQVINAFPHNFKIALSMTNAENTESVSPEQQSNFSDFKLKIHSEVRRKHSLKIKNR